MDIIFKGTVKSVDGDYALVNMGDNKIKKVGIRSDVEVNKGDEVIVVMDSIIDKTK